MNKICYTSISHYISNSLSNHLDLKKKSLKIYYSEKKKYHIRFKYHHKIFKKIGKKKQVMVYSKQKISK